MSRLFLCCYCFHHQFIFEISKWFWLFVAFFVSSLFVSFNFWNARMFIGLFPHKNEGEKIHIQQIKTKENRRVKKYTKNLVGGFTIERRYYKTQYQKYTWALCFYTLMRQLFKHTVHHIHSHWLRTFGLFWISFHFIQLWWILPFIFLTCFFDSTNILLPVSILHIKAFSNEKKIVHTHIHKKYIYTKRSIKKTSDQICLFI